MSDVQFEKRLEELENRVGIVPAALPQDPDKPSDHGMPSPADLLGVVLILAPIGVIGGMLTEIYLNPAGHHSAPSLPLTAIVALGHALLLAALTAAVVTWKRYPMLFYGLVSALCGYGLIGLGLPDI